MGYLNRQNICQAKIHEGVCVNYSEGRTMAHCALFEGYYYTSCPKIPLSMRANALEICPNCSHAPKASTSHDKSLVPRSVRTRYCQTFSCSPLLRKGSCLYLDIILLNGLKLVIIEGFLLNKGSISSNLYSLSPTWKRCLVVARHNFTSWFKAYACMND